MGKIMGFWTWEWRTWSLHWGIRSNVSKALGIWAVTVVLIGGVLMFLNDNIWWILFGIPALALAFVSDYLVYKALKERK